MVYEVVVTHGGHLITPPLSKADLRYFPCHH